MNRIEKIVRYDNNKLVLVFTFIDASDTTAFVNKCMSIAATIGEEQMKVFDALFPSVYSVEISLALANVAEPQVGCHSPLSLSQCSAIQAILRKFLIYRRYLIRYLVLRHYRLWISNPKIHFVTPTFERIDHTDYYIIMYVQPI